MDWEGAEALGWKLLVDWEFRDWLKVEEFDCVGFGCTGPSCERRALSAKSGSEESSVIAMELNHY